MRGGHEFFRVGADPLFEPRSEGVLGLVEHGALCGEVAFAFFSGAVPDGG